MRHESKDRRQRVGNRRNNKRQKTRFEIHETDDRGKNAGRQQTEDRRRMARHRRKERRKQGTKVWRTRNGRHETGDRKTERDRI